MNKIKLTTTQLIVTCFLLCGLMIIPTAAAPGDLDPSFGGGGIVSLTYSVHAHATALQPDGKIVVAGTVTNGTSSSFGVARYNANGSPDLTFGLGGKVFTDFACSSGSNCGYAFASSVAIQSDGKIVAGGGHFYYYYGETDPNYDFLLARYNADGSLDSTFGAGGKVVTTLDTANSGANDLAIQPDGKIVVAGSVADSSGNGSDFILLRYNADGSLDASFGTGGKVVTTFGAASGAVALVIQSDGRIVAAGSNYAAQTMTGSFALARYNTNGSLDASFGSDGKVLTAFYNDYTGAAAVAIQSDGKIVALGNSFNGANYDLALARYNADGSPDSTFGTGGKVVTSFVSGATSYAGDVLIQSDGKIIAVGRSIRRNSDGTHSGGAALARRNADGSPDSTFGANGVVITSFSSDAWWAYDKQAAALQSDGKIVVAGFIGPQSAVFRYLNNPQSTFTVTRNDDRNNATCLPGDCSLREAVNAANASATDDTINFASGLTRITLANEIVINNAGALTINGTGANVLTIDGGAGTNRIFDINSATVTISGVTLTGGNGTGARNSGEGGAIYANGSLTLDGVHVTGNEAARGGGMEIHGTGRIINSTFSANSATIFGGGFYSFGSLTVVNSTISGNTAGQRGGGFRSIGDTWLRNVTITNNTAQRGGGIYHDIYYLDDDPIPSTLNFGNTIVAGNTSTTGIDPEIYNNHAISITTSAGGNLVGDSPGDSANIPIVYQPTDIRDTNPMLGVLQNNGGTTPTHALLAGSPAIDKGLNSLVSPLAPTFDQRGTGFARIRDGNGDGTPRVDIGAFEVQLGATGAKPTLFDFDGDGKADVGVFRPSNGAWYLQQSASGFSGVQFGLGTDKIVPADYDGDGRTDVAVYRNGTWYLQRSRDGFFGVDFGLSTDIPVPADYSGDGKAEIAVFRPSDGFWYIYNLVNNQFTSTQFGQAGDVPVAADYDGDGKVDVAVFRNGVWFIQQTQDGFKGISFGQSGDKPVPADYDGDGKADIAVFRPSNGTWYLLRSQLGFAGIQFGFGTDLPVPADYDGDGKANIAVFRDGVWYLQRSQSGYAGIAFGDAIDKPVPNAFVP